MVEGSIALGGLRVEPRPRTENTLLVVGDAQVRRLADAARHRGWAVETFDPLAGPTPRRPFEELLIDGASLEQVRLHHPELLRQASRVWVAPPEAEPSAGARANPFEHPLPAGGRFVKRALDVVLALAGLVLVFPVLALAMLAVRLDSPGPVLFRQVRVGANGRRFRLYKLRTMWHGNDDRAHREYVARLIQGVGERCGTMFKLAHDPRITRVGRMLRHYSIDELPQLWNVLKGDMSLVGPRPPLPHETELYTAAAWGRMRVKPGITGPWQVSGRCELSFDEMVSLDVRYWQRWSLLSDLAILARTPGTVITGRGAA